MLSKKELEMSKIAVTVEFSEKEFKNIIEGTGLDITDNAKFKKIFASKAFAKLLAADLKQVWEENNSGEGDLDCLLESIFEDCVGVGEDA